MAAASKSYGARGGLAAGGERCYKCHGDVAEPKGDLKLTSRDAVSTGGNTGPAAVPGAAFRLAARQKSGGEPRGRTARDEYRQALLCGNEFIYLE